MSPSNLIVMALTRNSRYSRVLHRISARGSPHGKPPV
jgi:hypothetical protein